MAGIGFELRKLNPGDTLSGLGRAYSYAGIISSGPWLLSIFTMVLLNYFLAPLLSHDELNFFSASITHIYTFSLILVGPLQLVLTRYAADKFSARDRSGIFPGCLSALALTAVLSGLLGGWFFLLHVEGPILHRVSAAALSVYVSCMFITSNYLTALRDHKTVVATFAIGCLVSFAASWGAVKVTGDPASALAGFAFGHAVLFLLLLRALHREFGTTISPSWDVFRYFFRFPSLVFIGLFYNLGIWIDKLMFWWFSGQHVQISGWLYASPEYDVAICLSLLSIVPGMAVFFLKLETEFAAYYEEFFRAIDERRPLSSILAAKEGIVRTLRAGFIQLFKVQGLVTLLLVIFAEPLGERLGIGSVKVGIFRETLFGSFLLICFLSLQTVLFYVDDRKGALLCTAAFAIANATLSILTLRANEAWFGFGFVIASGLGMALAVIRVNDRVARLESCVFREQG